MESIMIIVGTIAVILIGSYIVTKATCGISFKKTPPCVQCKHCRENRYGTYYYYCNKRVSEITGDPQACINVRDTFSCRFEPKED